MSNVCILCEKPVLKYSIPKMSLHVFPSCPKKRQIWLKQCKLTDADVLPNRKICSFHFEPTCFKSGLKKRILFSHAVPTIFGNGHVKTTNLPFKITKGRPKNFTKKGIVVQNSKSCDILLAKAAQEVAGQNRKPREVIPRAVTNADVDRVNSIIESQFAKLDELDRIITDIKNEKLSPASLLGFLVKNQIVLNKSIK